MITPAAGTAPAAQRSTSAVGIADDAPAAGFADALGALLPVDGAETASADPGGAAPAARQPGAPVQAEPPPEPAAAVAMVAWAPFLPLPETVPPGAQLSDGGSIRAPVVMQRPITGPGWQGAPAMTPGTDDGTALDGRVPAPTGEPEVRMPAAPMSAAEMTDPLPVAAAPGRPAAPDVPVAVPQGLLPPTLDAPADAVSPPAVPAAAHETAARPEAVARIVVHLAAGGTQRAELALNPPELGALDLRLDLDGTRVDLSVHAHTAAGRELFEQALPRLREMLAGAGLQLGQADIGGGGHGSDQAQAPASGTRAQIAHAGDQPDAAPRNVATRRIAVSGLIDVWA